jgi:tetrapyrrole methylase family protein/MazG family protein
MTAEEAMGRFEQLRAVMDRLRDPGGCPWDREQDLQDLRAYVLEEAYEVNEAIDNRDHDHLREELGDLLLQVLFLSRIEQENGHFDVEDVIQGIHDKLIRRHPHVFGDAEAGTASEVIRQWEEIKNAEKKDRPRRTLDGVPRALPSLLRALRLSTKAALTGFEWEEDADLEAKVQEEIGEFLAEYRRQDKAAMERELGDLLFVLANVARRCGVDPEAALQGANNRFVRRFGHIEESIQAEGGKLKEATLERMEALWEEAKAREDSA